MRAAVNCTSRDCQEVESEMNWQISTYVVGFMGE